MVCKSCKSCCELKPQFFRPIPGTLIKATQPMERSSIDFKGPLPRSKYSENKFILTVVDEFSRFPWAIPCKDTCTNTAIECLRKIFTMFGTPGSIHSDRGSGFVSKGMKYYLNSMGINISTTTPYHPQGNGQCERLNGTIWNTVKLYAHSHELNLSEWEEILPIALHSIRSLLCTSTNCTPHERMFLFRRRPGIGYDKILPTWLIQPGPVLLRNFERTNKNDVLVKRVELIEANPNYAIIKDGRGITKTVSTKDLAPAPIMINEGVNDQNTEMVIVNDDYINTPQNIQPDEYDNMIEEAKSRNPEISIKRL